MIRVFSYAKCSTCRNALKWLDARGVKHTAVDIVSSPPSRSELGRLFELSGLPIGKFFNTSGESYRLGDFKSKLKTMSESQALDALAKDGKLIKRPLVDAGKNVLVGFDEDAFAKLSK